MQFGYVHLSYSFQLFLIDEILQNSMLHVWIVKYKLKILFLLVSILIDFKIHNSKQAVNGVFLAFEPFFRKSKKLRHRTVFKEA